MLRITREEEREKKEREGRGWERERKRYRKRERKEREKERERSVRYARETNKSHSCNSKNHDFEVNCKISKNECFATICNEKTLLRRYCHYCFVYNASGFLFAFYLVMKLINHIVRINGEL